MEIRNTFVFHILLLIAGGIGECLAVKHLILTEGDTLVLKCLKNSIGSVNMEWRNPKGHALFFNEQKGLKDSRTSVFTLNDSEFSINLSNVQLKDEGVYRCLEYADKITTKRYRVKVLGTPRIEMSEHGGHKIIKCTTAAHDHPPELSWLLSGIEIEAQPNTSWESGSNRSSVVSVLKVKTHIRKATVKCLAKHRALSKPLVDFITIENDSVKVSTPSYSRTTDKQMITETMITETSAAFISTEHMALTSVAERPEVTSTTESTTLNSEQTQYTDTSDNNSTEGFQTKNVTSLEGFGIENKHKPDHQFALNQSSPLLVLLVTCLILCLLIVVIFFAIKLRRAHLAWKRENEESDQSVESSKSKSSHEEKQAQERRRKGFWNSNFTVYKVEEETPQNVTNSSSTRETVITETEDSSRTASSKLEVACVKETEL
ncbi:Cytotoxic and regulatory T-cell molecule [Triplophysa tibetana]|uniref:Cytotoxic and regulatory T-cell molecule n=1 Tax=Triplophysa tibetana TaxID=1572043 RepID=A0A5A9N1W0_9TELE|nr:Cytotoxic and regulatory T-cell molecule [Triplophysa tibetana]